MGARTNSPATWNYVWHWRTRLPERKGQLCRVVGRGALNSILVEFFVDRHLVVTSRWAVRKVNQLEDPHVTYRDRYRPIIAREIAAGKDEPYRVLRARLRAAFPDGRREGWRYRVWLDEIRVQLGLRRWRQKRLRPSQPLLFDP